LIAVFLGLVLVVGGGIAFVTGGLHWPRNCEGPSPNWDNPLGSAAIQLADLNQAVPYLAFTPVAPRALGPAAKILLDSSSKPDRSAKSVLSVYEQPVYGRFWITESIADTTQDWIDSRTNNLTGCSENSVMKLRSGIRAALAVGRVTSVMWLDQGLLIDLIGRSLTKEQAIEVANKV
jgi:hypothetical protein